MPFYGLDRGIDKAFVDWGIKDPGTVAHKRASETLDATEAGNNEARDRALHRLNEIAENTSSNNTKGLTKAGCAGSKALQQRTPGETDTGISTTLEQIDRVQDQEADTLDRSSRHVVT